MKNVIINLLVLAASFPGFSQNAKFEFAGKLTPSVKQEKLHTVRSVNELTDELWIKMSLAPKDRQELDELRRRYYPLGYYAYPKGGYDAVIEYVSVEISAIRNETVVTALSKSDKLSPEQNDILNTAALGSEFKVKVKFKYKFRTFSSSDLSEIITGVSLVTVVPETEAEYPGGVRQFTEYLTENVINKVSKTGNSEKLSRAIVKFEVTGKGEIINAGMFRTSGNPDTDRILIDAINKMPKWRPARNSKGITIQQEFRIPFGVDGC